MHVIIKGLYINRANPSCLISFMESKREEILVGLLLLMAMLGLPSTTAHLPPATCIDHCLKECKLSGVGVAACVKYCPLHCHPSYTSSKVHYCNLGCMLDQCAKFTDDEKKVSDCVSHCHQLRCKIGI